MLFPGRVSGPSPRFGMVSHCYAMDSNALATYPFHWIGMQTIGMDTYGFVVVVVDAAP